MSDAKASIVDETVVFDIEEGKPWGEPDVQRSMTLDNDLIKKLRPLKMPTKPDFDFRYLQLFWLPNMDVWVVFVHESYAEKSMGPQEESVRGPFLVPDMNPPTNRMVLLTKYDDPYFQGELIDKNYM